MGETPMARMAETAMSRRMSRVKRLVVIFRVAMLACLAGCAASPCDKLAVQDHEQTSPANSQQGRHCGGVCSSASQPTDTAANAAAVAPDGNNAAAAHDVSSPATTPAGSSSARTSRKHSQPPRPIAASRPAITASSGRTPASRPAASQPGWVSLFDGQDMDRWLVAQGSAKLADGVIGLRGAAKDATILARGVSLGDGEVEVSFRRRGSATGNEPFTIGLRLAMQLNWTSLYFVCRPGSVEVCRGSSVVNRPSPEDSCQLEPLAADAGDGREVWRFVLKGQIVDCYRDGRKLLSYADTQPISGNIALTASRCNVDVLAVRYLATGNPTSRPASRPAPRLPFAMQGK